MSEIDIAGYFFSTPAFSDQERMLLRPSRGHCQPQCPRVKRQDAWTKYACASAAAFTRAYLQTRPVSIRESERPTVVPVPRDTPREEPEHRAAVLIPLWFSCERNSTPAASARKDLFLSRQTFLSPAFKPLAKSKVRSVAVSSPAPRTPLWPRTPCKLSHPLQAAAKEQRVCGSLVWRLTQRKCAAIDPVLSAKSGFHHPPCTADNRVRAPQNLRS